MRRTQGALVAVGHSKSAISDPAKLRPRRAYGRRRGCVSLTARLQCQGPGMGANCFRFNDGKPVPPILNPFRHKSLPAALSGQWPMRCTTLRIFDEAVGAAGMIVAISSETMSFEK